MDVGNVSYGINYFGKNQTRTYNTLNQMTNVTIGSTMNITYTFPAGTNNGKIGSQMDAISGETVTYQYDSLHRLLSASSSKGWSETYGFDGFGNLLSKTPTGGAPTLSQAVNAATNRIVGQNYDANGNQTSSSTGTLTYDAENRVLTAASNGIQYAYDSRNKRIWSATISGANMTQVLTYYGVDGQRLGTYTVLLGAAGPGPAVLMGTNAGTLAVFFGGKRIGVTSGGSTSAFTQDRLGSNGSYYPYGEARGTVPQDQVGFATYTTTPRQGCSMPTSGITPATGAGLLRSIGTRLVAPSLIRVPGIDTALSVATLPISQIPAEGNSIVTIRMRRQYTTLVVMVTRRTPERIRMEPWAEVEGAVTRARRMATRSLQTQRLIHRHVRGLPHHPHHLYLSLPVRSRVFTLNTSKRIRCLLGIPTRFTTEHR